MDENLMKATPIEGKSIWRPPYFDGTKYIKWKEYMKIFIQSVDFKLWLVIENGPNISKKIVKGKEVEKSEDEFDDEDMKKMGQDSRAKYILFCAVNPEVLERISKCKTAKQMWDELDREMAIVNVNSTNTQPQVAVAISNQYNSPNLDFLDETREAMNLFLGKCVPLYKHALEGNWAAAKLILDEDDRLKHAAISSGWSTVLHVAAGAKPCQAQLHFVQELLGLLDEVQLSLQDSKGNTAFCFAAAAGNMPVVKLMLEKDSQLPYRRGGGGHPPIQFAALQGRFEVASFLYEHDGRTGPVFEDWECRKKLFFACVNTDNYGLALQMVGDAPRLASERDGRDETALHLLAQKSLDSCRSPEHQNPITINPGMKQKVFLQLVNCLWETILRISQSKSDIIDIITEPSQLLFTAAEVGNSGFLSELISAYPSLIWEVDHKNRSIIHLAVMYRHASIYNLIHEIGQQKDIIVTFVEEPDENTLLHLAANLAPPGRLEVVSGAALQMCLQLLWFEEVKKAMPPSFIKLKNSEGLTARELFTREHAQLRKDAESWMRSTADSCMLISTVIATGVFAAALSLPGGINDDSGKPNYLTKPSFLVFAISDATALILSATAILIFLSILVSRYAEYDFYKSLPLKLIFGLITLFCSITSMMVAFGSAFFITYYHGSKWVPIFISVFACLPILLFMFLQFSLWSDIIYSTYYCRNLFKPGKNRLLCRREVKTMQ